MKQKLLNAFFSYKTLLAVYCAFAVIISIQSYFLGVKTFESSLVAYTHYNNYIIFKQAFFHLIENKDLYLLYPNEHWDFYKYSPTFAFLFAPLAYSPDIIGLIIWNLLNVIPLFLAVKYLPNLIDKKKIWILWFIMIELTTCVHNHQSNGLMAALLILSFVFFEKNRFFWATFFIVFSVYIKLFGAVAFVFILIYPNKVRNIRYAAFWLILLGVLPLLVTSFHQLISQYQSWGHLLSNDKPAELSLSVMNWLKVWFGINAPGFYIIIAGIALFCLPLLYKMRDYKDFYFRVLVLASVLIWVVIFNHKAERPTYIIAIAGVAIWFFYQEYKIENLIFLLLALLFTQLSATDIFPPVVRNSFIRPYVIKAVPCILIWCKIIYDLVIYKGLTTAQFNSKFS